VRGPWQIGPRIVALLRNEVGMPNLSFSIMIQPRFSVS
jgi:hypothetical protein